MAFDLGGSGRGRGGAVRPAMNVTPLVDVVLVLLIIFMVVTPHLTKQLTVSVPKKDDKELKEPPPPDDPTPQVLLSVDREWRTRLNQEPVADADLQGRLRRVFAARRDHVLFFDAHDDVAYGRAMRALDLARGGGALTIAVMTEPPGATP